MAREAIQLETNLQFRQNSHKKGKGAGPGPQTALTDKGTRLSFVFPFRRLGRRSLFLSFVLSFVSIFFSRVLVGHYDRLGRLTRICVGYT